MSGDRERETHEMAHLRTREDYLVIIRDNPDVNFGEYDNIDVLLSMESDGLIAWRTDKASKISSMFTTLWPELTDAGRSALSDDKETGE